jgi:rubrerythrin
MATIVSAAEKSHAKQEHKGQDNVPSASGYRVIVKCASCGFVGPVDRADLLIQPILGFARGPHRRRRVDVWVCDVCSEVWNQLETKLNSLEATDQTESEKGN